MHSGQGQQCIEHLSPVPLQSLGQWFVVQNTRAGLNWLLSQNTMIPPFSSICAPPPLSRHSRFSWFAVSVKLFNFTEISSTLGVGLSPQGWVTIRANYRKCQSEAILPLRRPREEEGKKFLTLIGTKPSPHGSFWGTDPSPSLVSISSLVPMLIRLAHALDSAQFTFVVIQVPEQGGVN